MLGLYAYMSFLRPGTDGSAARLAAGVCVRPSIHGCVRAACTLRTKWPHSNAVFIAVVVYRRRAATLRPGNRLDVPKLSAGSSACTFAAQVMPDYLSCATVGQVTYSVPNFHSQTWFVSAGAREGRNCRCSGPLMPLALICHREGQKISQASSSAE